MSGQFAPNELRNRNDLHERIQKKNACTGEEEARQSGRQPSKRDDCEQKRDGRKLEKKQRKRPISGLEQRREEQESGETVKKRGARRLHVSASFSIDG